MASSFLGLYVQREALLISQKALDITGNNISNINTPGYTRQRVDICSVTNGSGTLGYNTAVSLAGKGSDVVGIAQIRDKLLDNKVRNYSGDLCDVGIKTTTLGDVEDVFDSIEADELEASFASIVSKFKAAIQSFSSDHADRGEMANITLNSAESLIQCIVNYDHKLSDISEQALGETRATVKRVNAIFAEMGELNRQIKDAYVSMNYISSSQGNYEVMTDYGPLELKDQMHSLLDELSQYGNIYVKEEDDGTFTVDFANQNVVSGKRYAQMAVTEENPAPTNLDFAITTELLDKDEWYDLNVANGTGGDSQILIRDGVKADGTSLSTVTIAGTDDKDAYLLDTGSLRGYLDVFNGRGIFADSAAKNVTSCVSSANDALKNLADSAFVAAATPEELAELTQTLQDALGATVTDNGDGTYTATVGGVTILDGANYAEITVNADGTATASGMGGALADEPVTLGGTVADNAGEIAPPQDNNYQGIEYYRDMLNSFVRTITNEFNKVFATDEDGNALDDGNGNPIELFTFTNDAGEADFRTAALNFRIADCWKNNPEIIANPKGENKFEELDNVYVNRLLGVFTRPQEYGDGTVKDPQEFSLEKFVSHICDNLGSQVEYETGVYNSTDIMLTSVENARSEVMDVSMDEEGINMMNYQKWYNAISRMVTTLDEALDKLINGTGLVGIR